MSERLKYIQMSILSMLAIVATIGSLAYISITDPRDLKISRQGVPFFTAPVLHPDTGAAIEVDELVIHYMETMK
jgi:hypothetical protein